MPRSVPKPGRSLADLFPAQAAELHPHRNGALTAGDVSPGNNSKVWWQCARCGSEWPAVINNRTAKYSINCVACNRGRKQRIQQQATEAPEDSITNLAPALAKEWHPDKNDLLTPASTPVHWDQNIWWVCAQCGHEWPLPPRFRIASTDRGCPKCAESAEPPRAERPPPQDSLKHLNPAVTQQWHPTRNRGWSPASFAPDSDAEVWWLCQNPDCTHEWLAPISTRTTGKRRGCPVCQRPQSEIPLPGTSFADFHPDVVAEWHPTLNGRLDPYTVKPKSQKKVWWLCSSCGEVWPATVANRTAARTQCARCSYEDRIALRDRPQPGRSFAELFPELMPEWHPTLNDRRPGDITPGSDFRAWWICARGHVWSAHVYARTGTDKTGCPDCRDLPADGFSVADVRPDLADQWHPTLNEGRQPHEFSTGSGFLASWRCSFGHVWKARIVNRASPNGSGCPHCRIRGTSQQQIRLAHELEAIGCPVIHNHERIPVPGRSPVNADIVIPDCRVVIEFDGSHYHRGEEAAARDTRQTRALEAAGWQVIRVRPAPLEPLGGNDVTVRDGRDTKAVTTAVLLQLRALGCAPAHSDDYLSDPNLWAVARADADIHARLSRSLSTLFPEIAAEWHPTRNGDRRPELTSPGSRDKAWWSCSSCGHKWQTTPKKRTGEGSGCPECARARRAATHRTPKPGRSVAELKPDLLKIFHPTKNGDISLWDLNYGTTVELCWICPRCGHEWSTRTPRNTGCRRCGAKRRRSKQRPK
ncbi:zinc-ribbon domain-containing protein [Mycolicibacterium holsaticum]|uniref:zinc-ribbon domain-containing protein n=1 Tax=Mycolicibacterium holsaticum TaxID=152142 RepID=UPI001C7E09DE|nr:DUF559 domain-containing protein [Mycolicibacterium holsaticum DSM 44478 = JCM 12374]UNC11844.1 DUF559 domain-containing protein [Mycolicibacterium holsaticum DSM 44478 = JCM 12374]